MVAGTATAANGWPVSPSVAEWTRDANATNAKGMKKRKAKTGGVPRLSGRAVDGNEYQIPINLTEGWTWLDDGTEERRTAVAKACLSLRNPSHSTPASDSYSDGLKRGGKVI